MFEMMLVIGLLMVASSILLLAVAHYARAWFFGEDEQLIAQPVRTQRDIRRL